MFLYNVTIGVDQDVEQEWILWMKATHIPDVLKTGLFVSHKFYKILHDNEDGTSSYSVQYFAQSIQDIQQYLENHAPALIAEHQRLYRDKHVAFRTVLEEI